MYSYSKIQNIYIVVKPISLSPRLESKIKNIVCYPIAGDRKKNHYFNTF